jgi:hypothetical protein
VRDFPALELATALNPHPTLSLTKVEAKRGVRMGTIEPWAMPHGMKARSLVPNRYRAGSLRYIGPPSIVRLWKFLHTRARQRRLQTEPWRG